MRVFLDANVLFSAALGGEVFRLIWLLAEQGRLELFTSLLCWMEAEFNKWGLGRESPTKLGFGRGGIAPGRR